MSEESEVEEDPNDEVLAELKQAQSNLRPLLQWKSRHLKEILRKAKEQQARQQLLKKFEECDAKVGCPVILAILTFNHFNLSPFSEDLDVYWRKK